MRHGQAAERYRLRLLEKLTRFLRQHISNDHARPWQSESPGEWIDSSGTPRMAGRWMAMMWNFSPQIARRFSPPIAPRLPPPNSSRPWSENIHCGWRAWQQIYIPNDLSGCSPDPPIIKQGHRSNSDMIATDPTLVNKSPMGTKWVDCVEGKGRRCPAHQIFFYWCTSLETPEY